MEGGLSTLRATTDPPPLYRAFLSYSHKDAAFATRLHRTLETYRVPRALLGQSTPLGPIPSRLAPIFRDRDELPSAADLGATIRSALEQSLCLIVVASAASAVSPWVDREVRAFKMMGRGDRVFAIILDGEPNATERPDIIFPECFCPALRWGVDAAGQLTSTAAEPLAADARQSGDGPRDAVLKLIAGLLGVNFDRLRQRERLRRRRHRMAVAGLAFLAMLAAALAYIELADSDVAVPGGRTIRAALDRAGITIFRPVVAPDRVAAALAASRAALARRLEDVVTRPNWFARTGSQSAWEFGQVATALGRNPNASASDLALAVRQLTAALDVKPPLQVNGHWLGWTEPDDVIRPESSVWMLMGLAAVIPRAGELPAETRAQLDQLVSIAQEAADLCRNGDGGWNDVPYRTVGTLHYVYSSALALDMLLDLKQASLCWRGDCALRDAMIGATAAWLIGGFSNEGPVHGWRVDVLDDRMPDDNLTTIVIGALGRAAWLAAVDLPPEIRRFAYSHVIDFNRRAYAPSSSTLVRFSNFIDWHGRPNRGNVTARLFWLPWALDAALVWARLADRDHASTETVRAIARSIGHMAVGLNEPMLQETTAERALPFMTAETMAALDRQGPR